MDTILLAQPKTNSKAVILTSYERSTFSTIQKEIGITTWNNPCPWRSGAANHVLVTNSVSSSSFRSTPLPHLHIANRT